MRDCRVRPWAVAGVRAAQKRAFSAVWATARPARHPAESVAVNFIAARRAAPRDANADREAGDQ